MKLRARFFAVVAAVGLTAAGVGTMTACNTGDDSTITIGVYNSAGWTTEQAYLWSAYESYLEKNLVNEDGTSIFKFVNSSTTTLADEVNSFIAQGVDGIMIANTDATTAVEAACAADGVPYICISTDQTSSTVGEDPSAYCLGGVDPYFGDTAAFAQQWLDYIKADMATQGLDSAVVSAICFPKGFSPKHDEIIDDMKELISAANSEYANISIGEVYYAGGIPLANYVPAILTQFKSEIVDSTKAAYGTNYLLGFANGMGTMVTTLSEQYGVSGQPLANVKMLAVGYTPNTKSALESYILTEAEVGVEGFASGIIRIYNYVKGVSYTDTATYTNSYGIVNVPYSWHVITGDNYDDFQNYVLGGGSWDFDTYKPSVTADEISALLGGTSLSAIAAITNRTLAEIKTAHS